MRETVNLLVENDCQKYAMVQTGEGTWGLPTGTIDIGASFRSAVSLDGSVLSVKPFALLAVDAQATRMPAMYYLCKEVKESGVLKGEWVSAQQVLDRLPPTLHHSVRDYLTLHATREVA